MNRNLLETLQTVCLSADRSFVWETLKFPEKILCFDTETTGIESKTDSVIELGMVWVKKNEIIPIFQSLFKIDVPLPNAIIQLTGISNEELEISESFSEKIEQIYELIIESEAFLGHNLPFDVGFLTSEFRRRERNLNIPTQLYDTRNLSRMLFPEAPLGGLGGYSKWLKLYHDRPHRAISDATATAQLFLKCLDRMSMLSQEECEMLEKLSGTSRYGIHSNQWKNLRKISQSKSNRTLPISPWPSANKISKQPINSLFQNIRSVLSKNGWMNQNFSNFVEREEQIEYAELVDQSLLTKKWSLIEAGTGVGKTFGYLAPLVKWLQINEDKRVIISTFSKTLQEQLFQKDIPVWLDAIPSGTSTLLKGRSNYFCNHRFDELISRRSKTLSPQEVTQLSTLVLWKDWTQTGDFHEVVLFKESSSSFTLVQADPFACAIRDCPNGSTECFFGRQRQNATSAKIVVVNHSLLTNAVFFQPQLLGNYDAIIIDEAHRFEEVVRDTLTIELSRKIIRQLNEIWTETTSSLPDRIYNDVKLFINHFSSIEESWVRLLSKIKNKIYDVSENDFGRRFRFNVDGIYDWEPHFSLAFENVLKSAINELTEFLKKFIEEADTLVVLENFKLRLVELFAIWERIKIFTKSHSTWFELPLSTELEDIQFFSAPIDVSQPLKEKLFNTDSCGVLTSATLSVNEEFKFIQGNLGIENEVVCVSRIIPSPYDLQNQLKIVVPMFGPDAWDGVKFNMNVLNQWLVPALLYANVNTLVLSTSKKHGSTFAQSWSSIFPQKDYPVWLQGFDGSPSELIERFRIHQPAILIGYDSFWEGIDLPGTSLECIIVPRLPFAVPDDPIQSAKSEVLKENGFSDFWELTIPQAILKLKQGVGRIIRSENDFGLVILLDRRIMTKKYGKVISKSLPVEVVSIDSQEEFASYFTWINRKKKNDLFRN